MISAVMLNWKRRKNVEKILAGWQKDPLISEAIVWNNNPEVTLPPHPWAQIINTQQDMGLYTRFAAALLAKNDCILIHDDDLYIPPPSIAILHAHWLRAPASIHGFLGRRPTSKNEYSIPIKNNGRAPIVLTRGMLVHRQHIPVFFMVAPHFEYIMKDGKPYGNGEDILFSYVVQHQADGELNYVHNVPVEKLSSQHAICSRNNGWKAHTRHRTTLMRACQKWLEQALPKK